MKKNVLIVVLFFMGVAIYPQATAFFTCNHSVCAGDSLELVNRSVKNSTNEWSICIPAVYKQPEICDLGILDKLSAGHTHITMAYDSNYYLFLTNQFDSSITRIKYHRSWFDTLPEVTMFSPLQLGNKIFNPQGIQVRYDSYIKKWVGFVVNVDTRFNMYLRGNLARLDFGSSLDSIPAVTIIDTVQYHLMYPRGMQLEHDASGKWHLFVANASNMLPLSGPEGKGFSISHYFFSDSVNALPLWNKYYAYDMGSTSALKEPKHIRLLQNPAGEWYGIILNANSGLTRATLGYSLEYWPYIEKLPVISDLSSPVDFNLFNSNCRGSYAMFINGFASKGLTLVAFDSTLNDPRATTYPTNTKINYPVCMTEMYSRNDSLICFVVNGDNSILRVLFRDGCDSVLATYTDENPATIFFPDSGNYSLRLTINKDSANEKSFCRTITVVDCPKLSLSNAITDIRIYPTIVSDILNVEFTETMNGVISIYDEKGSVMLQQKINNQEIMSLSLAGLLPGLYLICISGDKETTSLKFIKE